MEGGPIVQEIAKDIRNEGVVVPVKRRASLSEELQEYLDQYALVYTLLIRITPCSRSDVQHSDWESCGSSVIEMFGAGVGSWPFTLSGRVCGGTLGRDCCASRSA